MIKYQYHMNDKRRQPRRAAVRSILIACLFAMTPAMFAQNLPTDGLMARWDFEEGSGPTARDTSGKGNDGTLDNYVDDSQWVPGRFGGGLAFNGQTGNRLVVPDSPSIGADLVNAFSVAAWFKPNSQLTAGGSGAAILEKGNAYFLLQGIVSGGMNFLLKKGGNRTAALGETLAANAWYHVTGVFDGSEARVYLNGELKGRLAVAAPIDTTDLPLVIGGDDGTRTFNGTIDQVAIWNRALTDQEILQTAGRSGSPTISVQPVGMTVFEGGTAKMGVTATGQDPLRYLWFKGNEPLRNQTDKDLLIEYVSAADAGTYHVEVTNDTGTQKSDAATLTVNPVAGLETARALYLRFDETTGLSAADASGNGNNGTLLSFPDNTSHWVPGQVKGSINYDLDVDNNLGSAIAIADSASLDQVTSEATVAFWMKPAGWGFVDNAGSYTRSATYVLRKGNHLGVRVIRDPGSVLETIVVRAADGADNGSVGRKAFEINAPQGTVVLNEWQHWVVLYRNGAITFYLNGFRLGEPVPGKLGTSNDSSLTVGAYDDAATPSITSSFDGGLDELGIWARPLSEAEILELAGKDVSGPPVIASQPASQNRIEGTTATFEVFVTGQRPLTYQWLKDGKDIAGATSNKLTVNRLKPSDAGQYSVRVSNSAGSTVSSAATLAVESLDAITSGLSAYYSFDDGPGAALADSSGNGLNGVLRNMDDSSRVTGRIGGALKFDGVDDYVAINHNDLLNLTSDGTVSLWLNIDGLSDGSDFDRVLRKGTTFDFVLINNGVLRFHGVNKDPYSSPTQSWEIGGWRHYAYTVKNGMVQWYRNGEPVGDPIAGRFGELVNTPLVVANYEIEPADPSKWVNRPYMGSIDDLGIWQRALSATDILGIYVNGSQGKPLNQKFEPLSIKSVGAVGGVIQIGYFSPFGNRPTLIESKTALGDGSWTAAEANIVDKGQGNFTATVVAGNNSIVFYRVLVLPPPPLFFDDFETVVAGWTHGGIEDKWARGVPTSGPSSAFSPTNVYATGLGANVGPNTDSWLRTPEIDLTGVSSATLSFAEWLNLDFIEGVPVDEQFHKVMVNVLDAATLTPLTAEPIYVNAGTSGGWQPREVRLVGNAVGAKVKIEFLIQTDAFALREGWFLDDVKVVSN